MLSKATKEKMMARGVGMKSETKGVVIPEEKRVPFAPDNIRLKKEEFVAKEMKRRENDQKAAAYRAELEAGQSQAEPKKEVVEEKSGADRVVKKAKVTE